MGFLVKSLCLGVFSALKFLSLVSASLDQRFGARASNPLQDVCHGLLLRIAV